VPCASFATYLNGNVHRSNLNNGKTSSSLWVDVHLLNLLLSNLGLVHLLWRKFLSSGQGGLTACRGRSNWVSLMTLPGLS
jgi:hypothetical protein